MENFNTREQKTMLNQIWLSIYIGTNLAAAGLLAECFDVTKRQQLDPKKVKERLRQFETELAQEPNPQIAQKAFQLTVKNIERFLDNY